VWEKSVPSHKVLQKEEKFENKIEKILLSEQPSGLLLCKEHIENFLKSLMKKNLWATLELFWS